MATNRIVWSGLEELKQQLRDLPAALAGEAGSIVLGAADGARADMHYPRRTGDLADHLTITKVTTGPFGAGAVVRNTSKHASLFENGTQARHTAIGANRGTMPPGHVFIPAVIRHRRAMYAQLTDLLVRHGLIVSGVAA
jgi:hypothetical protein